MRIYPPLMIPGEVGCTAHPSGIGRHPGNFKALIFTLLLRAEFSINVRSPKLEKHQSIRGQGVFPMELEESKEKALLFWFNTYGTSISLGIVNSLSSLWSDHLPSLLNCLHTDNNTRITASNALSSYEDLLSHFIKASVKDEIIASLSVEKAAAGNGLEIAKFLAVLLNEFRISKPDVITESVAVMHRDGHDVPLREILNAFDEEENDWWSVMIKRSDAEVRMCNPQCATPRRSSLSVEEFSGMSVGRSSFVTPCGPNRRRNNSINLSLHTVARCDGSPLLEAINSPKVRELRREREIRTLRRQLNEIEDQLMNSELQVSESRNKIESLVGEIAKKNERIRDLESNGKLSQRSQAELEAKVVLLTKHLEGYQYQCHSQKERLAAYKLNVEGLEEKQMDLSEQLETKSSSIAALERELRDVKDEAVKSLQQMRILDNERNTLMRLLEEERQAATSEREQYQRAISEWRKRLEAETANAMSIYSNEMGKNALLQQEIREKTEQLEKTRILYDSDKRSYENTIEEIKRRLQDKYDGAMKSLAEAEAKLSHQESRHKSFVLEHEAVVQQLESVHLAEIIQRDTKISAACTRIEELEAIMIDRERSILEQRKDLANITMEKDAAELKLRSIQIVLDKKEDQLHEATVMIEKLKEDLESIASKYNDTNRSLEIVQAECLELKSTVSRKGVEISEHVKDLKSLSEEHNEALDELRQTKQCLEEERKLLKCQESEARAIIEGLKEKELSEGTCEQQREEKKALEREDLLGLLKKFEKLEVKSLSEIDTPVDTHLHSSWLAAYLFTFFQNSEHLENEEELQFSAIRTQHGKLNEIFTAYIIYNTIYVIYNSSNN
ncbi:unnamed protein product [Angiostrongylus costaricensis]|uniref:LisH domain-containing protein n=1 Tax=Angiostrongylus costaricensis TaxID=334426 RepID=A0A0R3PZW7_ANGCS|nr:unnamed protein product [Angiostrongylus costaricensis]